ncbi:HipA domain-containing protein [Hespellia stercorisuis]|uniref:Serine/threonine-protein kinase HipA n=1 Tax=Hespellia stercorisuis DSM 15480 TaxID=1121950 RepID=A0A1M6WIP7_9FIRM|nr:HipA domain-containing protein [Hespellia stercorisuis]SHK93577.1 serine/threonine-protein kinase HipA [Hespellia stercorisuis DSM 15480]
MMKKLIIMLEIKGKQTVVGNISYHDLQDACFTYAEEYLNTANAVPISVSLPLQEESYSVARTKNFFEGLLPEGFTRRTVAQWIHVSEDDYLSILAGLGNECLGAIKVIEENQAVVPARYEKLKSQQIGQLAAEGATKSAELVTKSHLSLTGASGKVGLYYDDTSNQWFLPYGEAPSTHIVKQSHVRMDGIVTNEQLCLLTAQRLGITIPESFIINTGNAKEEEVLFATKRYDRLQKDCSSVVDGLRVPYRLHQEDFAQALGKASSEKYEKEDNGYLQAMFRLILNHAANPIKEQLSLWNMIVFDFLVGNTDNHIKNFSLLYSENLKGISLAPAYDIISTTVYEASTRNMGMMIGGQLCIDKITRESFRKEAQKVGINDKLAIHGFEQMASKFEKSLRETSRQLNEQGFLNADILCEKILQSGGFANL